MAANEYGLIGALLAALVGALVWHMRTTTAQLMQVVRDNTAAMSELRAALRNQSLCPYRELIREQVEVDCEEDPEGAGAGGGGRGGARGVPDAA